MRLPPLVRIVTVMLVDPTKAPLSVTTAVIVWVPRDRGLLVIEAPVPSGPLMLELHWMPELRLPSCAALAVPVKVMEAPWPKKLPLAGAVTATTGGVLV